jgi:flagellar motor switch/type III secretory pathway protein FliN
MAVAAAVEKPSQHPTPGTVTPKTAPEVKAETVEEERWKPVLDLPCDLHADLPLPGFNIADLLKLRTGSVIDAHWHVGRDVPLRLNGVLIGWIEFEVMGSNLAVRLTELA